MGCTLISMDCFTKAVCSIKLQLYKTPSYPPFKSQVHQFIHYGRIIPVIYSWKLFRCVMNHASLGVLSVKNIKSLYVFVGSTLNGYMYHRHQYTPIKQSFVL